MTTLSTDVVNDDNIIDVITRAGRPIPTLEIAERLAEKGGIDFDQVSVTRMRRILDRLEEDSMLVASGGPKRDEIPGWAAQDKRDVLWGTREMALRIEEEFERAEAEREATIEHRADLLLDLYRWTTPAQRKALGIVGMPGKLRGDRQYRNTTGATTWTVTELETVVGLVRV